MEFVQLCVIFSDAIYNPFILLVFQPVQLKQLQGLTPLLILLMGFAFCGQHGLIHDFAKGLNLSKINPDIFKPKMLRD